MDRTALRARYRNGLLEKTAFAHEMRAFHFDLEEYAELISGTRVARLEIAPEGITLESTWAPVRFHADLSDIGTPVFVTLTFGEYEPAEMEILLDLVREAEVFVDVGANIGWYALHAAAVAPRLRVLALEPVGTTFAALERNVALNGLAVEALQHALGEAPGALDMTVPEGIAGASSFHLSRPYPRQRTERVSVSTLDDVAERHDLRVDVLKVDVEGAELSVLNGGRRTLERDHPAVLAEMLRIHAAPFGYHPNDIIELMHGIGYQCTTASGGRWRRFDAMDESTVETNFLFLHRERHAARLEALGVTP